MVTSLVNARSLYRLLRRQVWALILLVQLTPLACAEAALEFDARQITQAQATLERLEREVADAHTATSRELKTLRKEITIVRTSAQDCVQEIEPQIALLDDELAVLQPETPQDIPTTTAGGDESAVPPVAPVSPAVTGQLKELQSRKADLEGRIATCKLMLLNSNDLESNVDDYLHSLQARQLLTRGASLPEVFRANLEERQRWLDFANQWSVTASGRGPVDQIHFAGAAAAGALGCILGFFVFRVGGRRLLARFIPVRVE